MQRFYLGVHEPAWLNRTSTPLFISRRRLSRLKTPPVASCAWALDSGGFSELSMYGEWRTSQEQYIEEVRLWSKSVGSMDWAAIQDWMCEPFITDKTGKSVVEHQERTIASYMGLMSAAPEINWTPVLQGWDKSDYIDHAFMYEDAGIDLSLLPIVGVGSICRREGTLEAANIMEHLSRGFNLNLHAFGFKTLGLKRCHRILASADSMAWSHNARHKPPMPGCTHHHCNNCLKYAQKWREELLCQLA